MSIYPVREDTLLLKENLQEQNLKNKKFLEIGVGNGEISLTAAKKQANVTAVDINPEAVQHTQKRFKEQNLDAEIFQSNLFINIKGQYDFIVFNPPYLKGKKGIGDEEMWRGGETGLEVAEKYLKNVSDYLTENGKAWIILSSQTNYEKLVEKYDLTEIDVEKIWFERLYLMEFE